MLSNYQVGLQGGCTCDQAHQVILDNWQSDYPSGGTWSQGVWWASNPVTASTPPVANQTWSAPGTRSFTIVNIW